MTFTDFLQAIIMMGCYTWPVWVLLIVVAILDAMQERKDRQSSRL